MNATDRVGEDDEFRQFVIGSPISLYNIFMDDVCEFVRSGLPFDDPFNVPENCIVDFSCVTFSKDYQENVSTAFIYLRNIDFCGTIDFSNLTYEQKSLVLLSYIKRDLKDLMIKQLDHAIFRSFFPNVVHRDEWSLFSEDESMRFHHDNKAILDEIRSFIVSVPLYVMSLDTNGDLDRTFVGITHTDEIPTSYECILTLLKYNYSDALCITNQGEDRIEPRFYDRVFRYENGTLADIVRNSLYSRIYRNIISIATNDPK